MTEPDVIDQEDDDVGAPLGAFTSNLGGAFASRASRSVANGYCGSAIGSTVRSSAVAGGYLPPQGLRWRFRRVAAGGTGERE